MDERMVQYNGEEKRSVVMKGRKILVRWRI